MEILSVAGVLFAALSSVASCIAVFTWRQKLKDEEKFRAAKDTLVAVKTVNSMFKMLRSAFLFPSEYDDIDEKYRNDKEQQLRHAYTKRLERLDEALSLLIKTEIVYVVLTKMKDDIYSGPYAFFRNRFVTSFNHYASNFQVYDKKDDYYKKAFQDVFGVTEDGQEDELTKKLNNHLTCCEKDLKKYL